MFIYHIILPEVWNSINSEPLYSPPSLYDEGFIHCSYDDQLDGVLGRYYADAEGVVILKIDTEKLGARLVAEPSTGGDIYPHIYGPINLAAVVDTEERNLG